MASFSGGGGRRRRERCAIFYDRALSLCADAVRADDASQRERAVANYAASCEYFIAGRRLDPDHARKQLVLERVHQFVARAEALTQASAEDLRSRSAPVAGSSSSSSSSSSSQRTRRGRAATASAASAASADAVSFADVVGQDAAKHALIESVILPQRQPQLFQGGRKPHAGILLYGPPGTGKTLLAKALAREAGCAFLSVSSADIMSKWQGDSEKAVRDLFERARRLGNCVIFIDEVDSLGRQRSAGEKASARRVKTELLQQMDGLLAARGPQGDGHALAPRPNVVVLGATNTPWELDAALRRRFQKRVHCTLPTEAERADILKLHLRDGDADAHGSTLTNAQFRQVARRTGGFSAADMATLSREALMGPVRKCLRSTHFKVAVAVPARGGAASAAGNTVVVPCGAWDRGARRVNIWADDFDTDSLRAPPVDMADMEQALRNVKVSVGAAELERYREFGRQFGDGRTAAAAAAATKRSAAPAPAPAATSSSGIAGFFRNLFGFGSADAAALPRAPTAAPAAAAAAAGPRSRGRRRGEEAERVMALAT